MVAINENSMHESEAGRRRTQPPINHLYQGLTLDAVTGLYYERNRDYSPSPGRWMEQDPAHYINGANTYQFVDSSPVGNVDPGGLKYTMTGGDMDSLEHAVVERLWSDGSTNGPGWTKEGAAAFVSYELNLERAGSAALAAGINLITSPIGAAKGITPSAKKVAKGVAKHYLKGVWKNLSNTRFDDKETEVWFWQGKVKDKRTGCMRTITANLYIVYDENSETFTGLIDGSVGSLAHDDGQPIASSAFHTFHYAFAGAITLAPAYFGIPIPLFSLGKQFGKIKPGSWRY